jgi:hypothetical protein
MEKQNLRNQIVIMEALIEISTVTNYTKEKLREQISSTTNLLRCVI